MQPTKKLKYTMNTKYNIPRLMAMKEFNIIIEEGEDGYLISEVIGLPGCHTQAKDMNELIERTKEAIKVYLKSHDEPVKVPELVGMQKITI